MGRISFMTAAFAAVVFNMAAGAQPADMLSDEYYQWTPKSRVELTKGVVYTAYSWDNVPRNMNVLEIDLSRRNVEIMPVFADDIIPNPNGKENGSALG